MTQQWCQVTYDLLTVQACDEMLIPAFIWGLVTGLVVLSLFVAIYVTWMYRKVNNN
jgi:hypothetical protein